MKTGKSLLRTAAAVLLFTFISAFSFLAYADIDLSAGLAGNESELVDLCASGVRVFDGAGLLTSDEEKELQSAIEASKESLEIDLVYLTVNGYADGNGTIGDFADLFYLAGGFGSGDDISGSMLIIDMKGREAYIYSCGSADSFMTDKAVDGILERLLPQLSAGDNLGAAKVWLNGEINARDAAAKASEPVKKRISPLEFLAAVGISLVSALAPVRSVRKEYAMEAEKTRALGFNRSYRADAEFTYPNALNAVLIDKKVTFVPLPGTGTGNRTASGTTVHTGSSGHHYSGRGGKF